MPTPTDTSKPGLATLRLAATVLLAFALVGSAWVSRSAAHRNSVDALEARLHERLGSLVRAGGIGDELAACTEDALAMMPEGVLVSDLDGATLCTTAEGVEGPLRDAAGVPLSPPEPVSEVWPRLRQVTTDATDAYAVCFPLHQRPGVPPHLQSGPRPPQPPMGHPGGGPPPWPPRPGADGGPPDGPGPHEPGSPIGTICAVEPADGALVGIAAATTHLVVSSVVALGLFGLALALVRLERRHARQASRRREDAHLHELGQLAMVLAHEVRTPLAALRGYAQLLEERSLDADTGRLVGRVVKETDRVGALVDDLAGYARPAPLNVEPLDARVELEDALARAMTASLERGVALMSDLPEGVTVHADRIQLAGLLDNLIDNALRASPPDEVVSVRAEVAQGELVVDVRDRGDGVPEEERARIFDAFYTMRADGTGLGLALALRIARKHGGRLTLVDHDGRGAWFRLVLPLTP